MASTMEDHSEVKNVAAMAYDSTSTPSSSTVPTLSSTMSSAITPSTTISPESMTVDKDRLPPPIYNPSAQQSRELSLSHSKEPTSTLEDRLASPYGQTYSAEPDTRPISQEQLDAEVKGIDAGLVMAEAKCIEVDSKQATFGQADLGAQSSLLNNEQWLDLIAFHRTRLDEHQASSASEAASKSDVEDSKTRRDLLARLAALPPDQDPDQVPLHTVDDMVAYDHITRGAEEPINEEITLDNPYETPLSFDRPPIPVVFQNELSAIYGTSRANSSDSGIGMDNRSAIDSLNDSEFGYGLFDDNPEQHSYTLQAWLMDFNDRHLFSAGGGELEEGSG